MMLWWRWVKTLSHACMHPLRHHHPHSHTLIHHLTTSRQPVSLSRHFILLTHFIILSTHSPYPPTHPLTLSTHPPTHQPSQHPPLPVIVPGDFAVSGGARTRPAGAAEEIIPRGVLGRLLTHTGGGGPHGLFTIC